VGAVFTIGRAAFRRLHFLLALLAGCLGHVLAHASHGPTSEIYIQDGASFEHMEFVLAGSAESHEGVGSVTVEIQEQASGLWLQIDGSWGVAAARVGTALSTPGTVYTRWLFRHSLPIGLYSVRSVAIGVDGSVEGAGTSPARLFEVVADRPSLDPSKRWLTIHFGRSIWGVAGDGECTPYADPVNGTVFLDETAAFLSGMGYTAQGSVPFGQFDPDPAVRKCPWRGQQSASLNDLTMLREQHGWTFVADSIGPLPSSQSDRPNIVSLICEDQITTTAASLAELIRLGHHRAWGLFADPGNSVTDTIRDTITSKLYSFTRKYGNNLAQNETTQQEALAGDWARFKSVNGGYCNDPAADCYDHHVIPGEENRYETPEYLFPFMIATPGNWRGIQFYRFVRGANLPAGYPGTAESPVGSTRETFWDCSASNPDLHWTSRAEVYCYTDFVDLMGRLATEHPDVVTTDAAHVAATWGAPNPNHTAAFPNCGLNESPSATAVSIAGTTTVGQSLTGTYVYTDSEGDAEGGSTFRWLRDGATPIAGATGSTYLLDAADLGANIEFEVTPVAQSGELVGPSVVSAAVGPVAADNGDPTVDITAPADGSTHVAGTPIALGASTFDPDGHTVTVSWTANGDAIAEPWSPPAGAYTLVASADDGHGGTATDSVAITVEAANQDPTVDITAPVDGSTHVAGTQITLGASTSDPDGHTVTVSWTANGDAIAEPWSPPAGAYTLVATADDGHGGTATDSVAITVEAANQDPTVDITAPADGSTHVAGTQITLGASTSDPDGHTVTVSWTANGDAIVEPWSPPAGAYTLVASADDGHGGTAADSVAITVEAANQDPTVDITAPADGSTHVAGTPIALGASTSDPDGHTVTVSWTANGIAIAAPWSPSAGSYTLVATANDGHGGTATDSVVITVAGGAPATLPATVLAVGSGAGQSPFLIDVAAGAQNLTTSWANNGANATAWFTLDLGSPQAVERLMIAPRGDLRYVLSVTIGDSLSAGKVTGPASGTCTITKTTEVVPSTLKECVVAGTGRYVTVQGDRPFIRVHGVEVFGTIASTPDLRPVTVASAGANAAQTPFLIDVTGGAQDLTTSWVNDGANSTAWFTLDLGAAIDVERLMVAPRNDLRYVLTVTIGNTLSGGKVTGPATGACTIAKGSSVVPTALKECRVGGSGRYITIQGDRPFLRFHGLEVYGAL
jgi:hypothetical protein